MKTDASDSRAALDALTDAVAVVSDIYAMRCAIERDRDWFALKIAEEAGELLAEHLKLTGRGRRAGLSAAAMREALADEAADVFAMLLLYCRDNGIDLTEALNRKWFKYLDDQQ